MLSGETATAWRSGSSLDMRAEVVGADSAQRDKREMRATVPPCDQSSVARSGMATAKFRSTAAT